MKLMDLSIPLTGLAVMVAIIGSNFGFISWIRSDMKYFENKLDNRLEFFTNEFRKDLTTYRFEIAEESKDFHGRLCSIESRYHRVDLEK